MGVQPNRVNSRWLIFAKEIMSMVVVIGGTQRHCEAVKQTSPTSSSDFGASLFLQDQLNVFTTF